MASAAYASPIVIGFINSNEAPFPAVAAKNVRPPIWEKNRPV